MNAPNTPMRPETLDELLSADIDGELERAAADHGLPLADARSTIATPAAVARRAALVQARDLVPPAVPLDPADTDRLVAGALEGARRENELVAARRRRNRFDAARRVTVAAASIIVVFGAIALLARGGGSSKSSGSKAASSSAGRESLSTVATVAPKVGPAELGDVSTPDALRDQVLHRLAQGALLPAPQSNGTPPSTTYSGAKGAAVDASASGSRALALLSLAGPRGLVVPKSAATDRLAATAPPTRSDCVARLVQSGRVLPAVPFSGAGTSDGQPVYVVAFRGGAGYEVYVLRASDCSVLRHTAV